MLKKTILFLTICSLFAGCMSAPSNHSENDANSASDTTETEKNTDTKKEAKVENTTANAILNDLENRKFTIENNWDDDEDGIDPNTVQLWKEAESPLEDYEIIVFDTKKTAQSVFDSLPKYHYNMKDQSSNVKVETDPEDGEIEVFVLKDNLLLHAEREDDNLNAILNQFNSWKLL